MTEEERKDAAYRRYGKAMHAVQSGVAFMIENGDGKEVEPKHLRVGVASALNANGAIVKLLMRKGLISEAEYAEMLAEYAEKDQASYERAAAALTGAKVKFE